MAQLFHLLRHPAEIAGRAPAYLPPALRRFLFALASWRDTNHNARASDKDALVVLNREHSDHGIARPLALHRGPFVARLLSFHACFRLVVAGVLLCHLSCTLCAEPRFKGNTHNIQNPSCRDSQHSNIQIRRGKRLLGGGSGRESTFEKIVPVGIHLFDDDRIAYSPLAVSAASELASDVLATDW